MPFTVMSGLRRRVTSSFLRSGREPIPKIGAFCRLWLGPTSPSSSAKPAHGGRLQSGPSNPSLDGGRADRNGCHRASGRSAMRSVRVGEAHRSLGCPQMGGRAGSAAPTPAARLRPTHRGLGIAGRLAAWDERPQRASAPRSGACRRACRGGLGRTSRRLPGRSPASPGRPVEGDQSDVHRVSDHCPRQAGQARPGSRRSVFNSAIAGPRPMAATSSIHGRRPRERLPTPVRLPPERKRLEPSRYPQGVL